MKIRILLVGLMVGLLLVGSIPPAFAEGTKVVVDLKDLDDFTRNKVMDKLKQNEENTGGILGAMPSVKPEVAREWVSVFTKAIKDLCHDLNVEVNEFIKTPVGMIVAGTIIYKVIGKDVLSTVKRVVFATVGWFVTMFMLYFFVARKFFIRRKLKYTDSWNDKDRGLVKREGYTFVTPFEFKSNDAKAVAASFMVGIAIAITIVAMVTVLI